MTNGYVVADLVAIFREASIMALKRSILDSITSITNHDFILAIKKVGNPTILRSNTVMMKGATWDDIGGLFGIKKQLIRLIEWPLTHKDALRRMGLRSIKGLLLYGPPGKIKIILGCSKTSIVKIIASIMNSAFFSMNGASLYSSLVGESEAGIRLLFQNARSSSPAIIFLDEIEALVGKRGLDGGGSRCDVVQERILSTLLNEMDGIETAIDVLVIVKVCL